MSVWIRSLLAAALLAVETAFAVGPLHDEANTTLLILGADGQPITQKLHTKLLRHMPSGVRAWVLVGPANKDVESRDLGQDPVIRNRIANNVIEFVELSHQPMIWVRDNSPMLVLNPAGYYELILFRYPEAADRPGASSQGRVLAERMARGLEPRYGRIAIRQSDLILQYGNVEPDADGNVFVSELVYSQNPGWEQAKIESEIKGMLHAKNVEILPMLPSESTGHVDIYMKAIGRDRVILASSEIPEVEAVLEKIRRILETKYGKKVDRIPFAAESMRNQVFRSYTNSKLAGRIAFVPSYTADFGGPTDELVRRDAQAVALYERLGFTVESVPAYNLSSRGGAVHCMTSELRSLLIH